MATLVGCCCCPIFGQHLTCGGTYGARVPRYREDRSLTAPTLSPVSVLSLPFVTSPVGFRTVTDVCLPDDHVPAAEDLLDGLRAHPVAREPEATILAPHSYADCVVLTRLAPIGHRDLQRCIAIDRDRRTRVRDVLDARLAVERRRPR